MKPPVDRYRNPADLISQLGIREPREIDVEAIAEFCGATVVYDQLDGCLGSIIGRRDRAIITVNGSAPRGSQRFSAAHELGHWLLDHGNAGFACTEETMAVDWWNEEGEEVLMTPEQRANEWASELLLPDPLVAEYFQGEEDISFAGALGLAKHFGTNVIPAAMRLLTTTDWYALFLSTRPGQPPKCLKRSMHAVLQGHLRAEPGPGTVAHRLLHGSPPIPGPVEVAADGWIDLDDAWWFTVHEDSILVPGGEVLTLLNCTGDTQNELAAVPSEDPLESEPGEQALLRLESCLREQWGYRRLRSVRDKTVLLTEQPSRHRLVFPDPRTVDAETIRALIGEVARHKGEGRDSILLTMVPGRGEEW